MRAGYSVKRIKDICGKGSSNVAQKDLEGHNGEYPIYGASGLIKNVDFYHQENECIGLVKDGSIGKVFVLPPRSSVIGTLQYIFPKEGYTLRFVAYCLQSLDFLKYKVGAVIPHIYFRDYGECEILVPDDIVEQQRIVDLLDQEFAKIDALKANAEKSLQAAKDLYQATLKKELEPKEGWKPVILKDIAVVRVGPFGSSLHKKDYISGGTPLVNPIHMKDGRVTPDNDFSVDDDKLKELCNYTLKEGDIVFARRGEIGRCALITEKEEGYLCGTGSLFVRLKQGYNSKFLITLFNSPSVKEQLLAKATGATMLNINSTSVENLDLYLPSSQKQKRILSCIDDLNDKCKALQQNYRKTHSLCDDLKQALLRKAFNGEL